MEQPRPLILYHANCADGFCAAWVAHRCFGDNADYVPVQYGEQPPDVAGRDVYILDFSYKRPVMEQIIKNAFDVCVLDHHKTAEQELTGLGDLPTGSHCFPTIKFAADKSGGRMAWEYFFPHGPSPWLVDYTEDRDLWRWKLEDSREVNACLASWPRTFAEWHKLAFDSTAVASFAEQGAAILRYQQTVIDQHVQNAVEIDMDGYKILAVNATTNASEIAGKLAENRPFGACWFRRADGKTVWSLRSRDGGIDVSRIAVAHGGGGHKNAAGFEE